VCYNIRKKIIEISYRAKSCHIGSSLSCLEALQAILDVKDDDYFIFSKASGVAAYYALTEPIDKAVELLKKYPLPSKEAGLAWSGGSLGQGLSVACGIALTGKKVFVLMSDGELQEGQTWEAIMFAAHYKLPIVAVIDRNRKQALGDTEDICKLEPLFDKFRAFGWKTYEADGHNKEQLKRLLSLKSHPLVIIANTIKGKGVPFMENDYTWHYKNLNEEEYKKAVLCLDASESKKG
jgi:transketolase